VLNGQAYFTRFQSARGGFGSLPPLARSIVALFAVPGIVLLGLSILLGFVSILVLLLLTVPVYQVLQAVFGSRRPMAGSAVSENPLFSFLGQMAANETGGSSESPGRKQVDAKVIDADIVE
jgi:hypothetical protein